MRSPRRRLETCLKQHLPHRGRRNRNAKTLSLPTIRLYPDDAGAEQDLTGVDRVPDYAYWLRHDPNGGLTLSYGQAFARARGRSSLRTGVDQCRVCNLATAVPSASART